MWPNSQFPVDLFTFTEEIRNRKLQFLCSLKKILIASSLHRSKQTISLQFFKGCLPQILPGPFLNTLSHKFNLRLVPRGRSYGIKEMYNSLQEREKC